MRGFIQTPILIAIVTSLIAISVVGYVGYNQYKSSKERDALVSQKEIEIAKLQKTLNQKEVATSTPSLEGASSTSGRNDDIAELRKEIAELKNGKKIQPTQSIYKPNVVAATPPIEPIKPSATPSLLSGVEISKKITPAVALVRWEDSTTVYTGSGFFIGASGELLTNQHVVGEQQIVDIILGSKKYVGRVIGSSYIYDVALIKVNDVGMPYVKLGDSGPQALPVGTDVYAFGFPKILTEGDVTVTKGILSRRMFDGVMESLQTDAPIHQGNSGGPLTNASGEVVGINTSIYNYTGLNAELTNTETIGGTGIGWAIPSNVVQALLDGLRNQKQILDIQCKSQHGQSSYYTLSKEINDEPKCDCGVGYKWNDSRTMCTQDRQYWCQSNNPKAYTDVQAYSNGKFSCICFGSPPGADGRTQEGGCKSPQ